MDQSLSQDLRGNASVQAQLPPENVGFRQENHTEAPRAPKQSGPDAVVFDLEGIADSRLGTTYEITGRSETRSDVFKLQSLSMKMLENATTPKGKKYRVAGCIRSVLSKVYGVDVLTGKAGKAKFSGLQSCGSVWNCRYCQKKIHRVREREIQTAMDAHFKNAGSCVMVTFTHGHKKHDPLLSLLEGYSAAMADMTSWRVYKKLLTKWGISGHITALETTFGWANGWHPHGHRLDFLDRAALTAAECAQLKRALFKLWKLACVKHGLPAPSAERGVDVTVAWSPAEYMAKFGSDQKWGTGKELTRLNSKTSTNGERFTPNDLLRAFDKGYKPEVMKALYREFCFAYYNKRQLVWSRNLKDRFGINDIDDAEAVEVVEEEHKKVGNIPHADWRRVVRRGSDYRDAVLATVETLGFDVALRFIQSLHQGNDSS